NCVVLTHVPDSEPEREAIFVRGAHMINAFGCRNEHSTYYLNDVVDGDWFLRAEN
ncbi:hypothetical protein R3P38DRAFT_2519162, partial [Favolaschia claudopus]